MTCPYNIYVFSGLFFFFVFSILNKLTPEKFDKLCLELLNVGVESKLILKGVILLVSWLHLFELQFSCMLKSRGLVGFDGIPKQHE